MRCEELKNKLSGNAGALDKEAIDHIRSCPECAKAYEASRLVNDILGNAESIANDLPFEKVRDNINQRLKRQSKLEIIMSEIKEQINARPGLFAGLGLTTALFLLFMLVPFSYDQTVGFNLAFCCVDSTKVIPEEVLEGTLSSAGYENIKVDSKYDQAKEAYTLAVSNLPNESSAKEVASALAQALETDDQPEIKKVTKRKAGTLYSQAVEQYKESKKKDEKNKPPVRFSLKKQKMFINGNEISKYLFNKNMTDEEISDSLENSFEMDNPDNLQLRVKVKTMNDNKERVIYLKYDDSGNIDYDNTKFVVMGAKEGDMYLGTAYDKDDDEDASFDILIDDGRDTLKGRGMIMKVYLEGDEDE